MASAAKPDQVTLLIGRVLSRRDLAWLVCPVCRSPLDLLEAQTGVAPGIRCTGCERLYPVIDGLPVLLAERATLTAATKDSAT